MLSKNQLKLINSLEQKKQRKKSGLFLVQGEKNVGELFHSDFVIKVVIIYKMNIGVAGIKNSNTNNNLQRIGSVSKYSPNPPQIPANFLFDLLLTNFLICSYFVLLFLILLNLYLSKHNHNRDLV